MKRPRDLAAATAWSPPEAILADVIAFKNVAAGRGDMHEQKRVMAFIINDLCRTYDFPWRPDALGGVRATDLACGRVFVGQQIVKLINANPSQFRGLDDGPPEPPETREPR
jgi:hypothetical protein